ncbi:pyrethroid hydrolase Ces2a-like [Lingula anatina]|uniref:Pyrethroid hydrolase Ces2a-like n=1 Tax=Lingula anatina TaxID=7574 RepID=A0A1S3I0G7_LINAN|nr:pyrethroid hydrolase Ces2a-like [Lingula anatina]|eukprot:XP_013391757.1 pyrethroid hydrolase Ces2a-like [Lingula anatina]
MGTILPNTDMSEDCLPLNIYAPVTESKELRAVMVWIHGGGYGAGQEIDEAFGKVDWMVGSLSDEGNLMLYMAALMQGLHGYNFTEGIPEDVLNTKLIPPILKTFYSENPDMVKKYIHDFYTHKADRIENTLAYRDMFSDIMFNQHIPESSLAHLRAKGTNSQASTYSYHITHVLSGHSIVDFYMFGLSLPPWATCSSHADDVPLTFGKGYFVSDPTFTWTEEDQRAADVVMTYWTNFAKTGNPNQGRPLEGVATWEEYTKDKKGYINIGKQTEMGYDLLPERIKLWMRTIPEEIERERASKQKPEL